VSVSIHLNANEDIAKLYADCAISAKDIGDAFWLLVVPLAQAVKTAFLFW
jgi:hypothetical protein